ncbi:hypothetical protein [Mesohalobacter halotolerans]|nr:hypothetical protein [Mesohalobacter halotolerans]
MCGIQKKPTLGQAHLVFANAQNPTLKNQKSLPFPNPRQDNEQLH